MSKIKCANLIEAAVAAADLRGDGYEDKSKAGREIAGRGSFIIGRIQYCADLDDFPQQSLDDTARDIAAALTHRLVSYWLNAWVRYRLGVIERALGLPHSAETQAALDARASNADQAWDDYCNSFGPAKAVAS